MGDAYELDETFPVNVSEIVKLIQERISKTVYKFKYEDSEESQDQDFYLRFICIQGWFIRCSFKTKVGFLKRCAMQINDFNILINIINTLYTIASKDRIYSLARGNFQAADMKLLPNDNRCLHIATLEKVMTNEINWFKTLSNNKQYIFLIKLISFADGSVVMNNIFAHFIDVLHTQSRSSKTVFLSRSKVTSLFPNQNDDKVRETIKQCFHKLIPAEKAADSITNSELTTLLLKWKQFINRYTEYIYSPSYVEELGPEENFSIKVDKEDTGIDVIQKHPIWVTLSILGQLENPQTMSRVNDYWATTAKEFKGELLARKILDREIDALKEQITTININKNVSHEFPDLRETTTDITKPSFRKKIKQKNVVTNYSLISEVYKDYLVDFNLYSKKLQSFPRAMNLNKPKTCNI